MAETDIDALREAEAVIAAEGRGNEPPGLAAVLRQVSEAIQSGAPRSRAADVAGALGMSVRTLQRRLARSGLTFTVAVQGCRLGVAARLLAETNVKVIDIALVVGYADHAHFTRAFRRWTGATPVVYRRMIRGNGGPTSAAAPSAGSCLGPRRGFALGSRPFTAWLPRLTSSPA